MQSMSSQASSWTLIEDFFVQECCVHGTDLENQGPTSILCDDPLPIESIVYCNISLQITKYHVESSVDEHDRHICDFQETQETQMFSHTVGTDMMMLNVVF